MSYIVISWELTNSLAWFPYPSGILMSMNDPKPSNQNTLYSRISLKWCKILLIILVVLASLKMSKRLRAKSLSTSLIEDLHLGSHEQSFFIQQVPKQIIFISLKELLCLDKVLDFPSKFLLIKALMEHFLQGNVPLKNLHPCKTFLYFLMEICIY